MKNSIIVILIMSCIVLWVLRKKEPIVIEKEVRVLVDSEVKRVNNKIDKEGFKHAVISEVENTVNSRAQIGEEVKKELDSVTKLLGVKTKQLNHYISYAVSLEDSLLAAKQGKDSVFRYEDKWTNISFAPNNNGGYFNFKYNAEINYTEYWKREGLFRNKKHYVDFWISDNRATVNGVNRIKFNTEKKASTLTVNALAMYHDGIHAGVDGQIRVIGRYWLGGGYLYDFDGKEWKPVITTRFNLIDW